MKNPDPRRRLLLFVLALVSSAAEVASAAQVLTAKSLACAGSGPQAGSISASEREGILTLRFQGSGLVPGAGVACGFTCGMIFTNGPRVSCGTVAANGRFSAKVEIPFGTCVGFIPFFDTPSTGKCVPSAIP
jgi:hypothetical protein